MVRFCLSPAELETRIAAGTAPVVVDVRSAAEFARGHVPGAIHIPFWRVRSHVEKLPHKDSEIVVYCGHGPRAAWAMRTLARLGFTHVIELSGHWSGWVRRTAP